MPRKNPFITLLTDIWNILSFVIVFITTLYTFGQLVNNNVATIIRIVIISLIVFWFTLLLWIAFSKYHNGRLRYKKPFRVAASILIVLSAAIIVSYFVILQNRLRQEFAEREAKTVIVIFAFDGPDEKYGIRNQIFEQLSADFSNETEFEIIPAEESINPTQGNTLARELSQKYQADVAIWGWYQPIANPNVTLHVENLSPVSLDAIIETNTYVYRGTTKELDSFELQSKIGTDVSGLVSFLSGYIHYKGGNYNRALPYFEKALQTDWVANMVNQRDVFMNVAIEYTRLKQWNKAIELYTYAIVIDPEYSLAYINRGFAYANTGQYELANADYDRAIYIDREDAEVYENRGNAKMNLGQYADAIMDYNQAIDLDSTNLDAYANRGNAYANLKMYDLAIADYNRVISLNTKYVSAYYNRALVYAKKKNYSLAIQDFSKVIDFDPRFIKAYVHRGMAYQSLDNYDNALADYNKAIELDPSFTDAYNKRGYAYFKLGKYNASIVDFNKVIELDPSLAIAYKRRGMAYQEIGKQKEADADSEIYRKLTGTP